MREKRRDKEHRRGSQDAARGDKSVGRRETVGSQTDHQGREGGIWAISRQGNVANAGAGNLTKNKRVGRRARSERTNVKGINGRPPEKAARSRKTWRDRGQGAGSGKPDKQRAHRRGEESKRHLD